MNKYYISFWDVPGHAYLEILAEDYANALQLAKRLIPQGQFSLWEEGDLP